MSRSWLLGVCLVLSALALVNARYHERRLYAQLERLERTSLKLGSDIQGLRVQVTSLRAPTRLDRIAKEQLGMMPIRPGNTLTVQLEARP